MWPLHNSESFVFSKCFKHSLLPKATVQKASKSKHYNSKHPDMTLFEVCKGSYEIEMLSVY